jgi:hypothetical protein
MLLGTWGFGASMVFDSRARRHRERIDGLLGQLDATHTVGKKTHSLNLVWLFFHAAIVVVGCVIARQVWQ